MSSSVLCMFKNFLHPSLTTYTIALYAQLLIPGFEFCCFIAVSLLETMSYVVDPCFSNLDSGVLQCTNRAFPEHL
jgi:hypothetical protein